MRLEGWEPVLLLPILRDAPAPLLSPPPPPSRRLLRLYASCPASRAWRPCPARSLGSRAAVGRRVAQGGATRGVLRGRAVRLRPVRQLTGARCGAWCRLDDAAAAWRSGQTTGACLAGRCCVPGLTGSGCRCAHGRRVWCALARVVSALRAAVASRFLLRRGRYSAPWPASGLVGALGRRAAPGCCCRLLSALVARPPRRLPPSAAGADLVAGLAGRALRRARLRLSAAVWWPLGVRGASAAPLWALSASVAASVAVRAVACRRPRAAAVGRPGLVGRPPPRRLPPACRCARRHR